MSDKVNWDEFTPVGKPAAKTPAVDWSGFEVAKPSNALRKAVGDKVVGFASGAVGATKALADVAGAGNVVSSTLGDVGKGIDSYLSPEAKADQQEQSAIMAGATGKGTLEGVKAGFRAFGVAPVQTAVQGLGSVVPILAGTALTGGALPSAAAGGAIGVAMGAGTAKGAIYDEVKKRSLADGMSDADAKAAATTAQEYGGVNSDQIALGGALGAADALTGVSAAATRMARGALGKPVTQAITDATERGFVGRAGMGMLKEMPLEAAQGGQEQVAANLAAQRAGFEAGTWDNVASNATLEALASAGPGAAFGAMSGGAARTEVPAAIENPAAPLTESPPVVNQITGETAQTPVINPVREQVAQAAAQGGALSGAALVAIDTGAHQATAEVAAAAAETESAAAAAKPGAKPAAPPMPAYSLFDGSYQDGDLHDVGGKPYRSEVAARMRMNATPGSTMEQFSNGFVIRRPNAADEVKPAQTQEANHGASTPPAGLDQPAAAKSVDQLAGGRTPALGAVPAGGGESGNAGVAAEAPEPGAAVVAAGSGTAAIAVEMRATQGHWDKLHARADKITAPAVKQAQMAFENAEIDAAAFEAVIASAEKGANQPAATAAPAQQKAGTARDQAIVKASSAAKDVLTKGGTEADANRAATDFLIGKMADNPGIRIAIDAPAAVTAAKQQAAAPAATAQAVSETVAPAAPAPAVAATPVKWFGTKAKAGAYLIKNTLVKTHEVVDAGKGRFEVRERAGTTPQAASAPEATPATSTVKGKRVVNSKFPPTEVSAGQTVRKDGKDYVVTGPIKGGISAARQVSTQGGVTETDTIFLMGDDAIEARIEAQKQEPEAEAVTPQVAAAAIVVDKAEMRPYRKPDGSVGYEAVPIQEETPAAEANIQAPKIGAQMLDERIKSDVAKKQAEAPVAPPAIPKAEAKPDPLTEKEKAAKAKMFGALGKLAALAGKNTRMNWTPEEEQQLLPIVIELFDGAMELGSVTFQKAVRYVRDFISSNLDQETADAIPFETLQGAYIHTARKFKDQGATTGKEVMSFDSLAELENSGEQADTEKKDTTNDSTEPTDPPALNRPLDEGQRPAGSKSPARGARAPRSGAGRANDGGVRSGGKRVDGESAVGEESAGVRGEGSDPEHGSTDRVAGGGKRVSAPDFIPGNGGLTREGSWFETAKRNIDLIELAIQIEKEGRPATADEQAQLAKYVGFGASEIRNALFPVPHAYAKSQEPTRLIWPNMVREARWKPLAERMDALPREWQQTILQSSQYAHYTSEGIIRSIWSAIERLGFTGGKVFEPGMGIGSFAMLMPENVRSTSRYTGVEFDGPTALIARLLSPQQHMLHGDFIKRTFPKNFFDVNVGNPPFSQTKVLGDPNYEKHGFMLHDFFFAKGIDLVRPGGLQVFVTSKGTMDKQTDKARKYLSERADLLGAIRLPSTAFEGNAGTSVVTDVIFLRKRLPGEAPAGEAWNNTATIETQDGPTVVNEYFAKHPEMVLGQQRISGNVDDAGRRINSNGMGGEKYTVVSYDTTPAELDAKFAKAIENLPENAYSIMGQSADSLKAETAKVDFDPSIKREGVVYLGKDGAIMRVESGMGKPLGSMVKLSDKDKAWFKGYVGLRDAVQLARQAQHTDGNWEAALKKLNKVYDQFRKEHGPIIDFRVQVRKSTDEDGNVVETESRIFKNNRLLREDYDRAILTALESISESGEIIKAPFLTGRTIGKPVTREVRSIGDALAVSLDEVGSLNMDDVARRMKISPSEAIDALGSQIYQTPEGVWQLADEYLSGNVVEKLEEAMQAVQHDPSLKRNVEALKEAQPEKLGPSQISAKLGASWVPAAHVNEFAKLIEAGTVTFDSKTETWQVDGGNLRSQRKAGAEYGTAQRSPSELLEAALNSRTVKVMQTIDKKTTIDEAATVAATEAVKKIKDKFKGWIWTDSERATELVESYNHRYNNIAPRKFDGSHLTLPGVSLRFKLHPHQLRAIWRMVQAGNTYLAHAVGAGKTIEMIAGGMEQKRLGLIKKPMYVVPNHMLEQFSNEFMELYPLANIMVADDENFSADRRKAFIASATLNNPDAIVITHDAFQRIGVKEESVAPIRDEILADLEIELSETAKDQGARVRRGQLEQQIEAVKQRFDRIIGAGGKDSIIKFEDMGVDFVFADESHAFRKLDFHTAQQIKGIDPNGSKRAMDMYVKTRILDKQRTGRAFVFASGTPVTNTMGELYTIMRFFASEELDRAGISTFDAWARQFGEVAPALEPNAAGKYEMVERFAKFDNVPELMSRVRQFMDVLTSDSLGSLVKRPDLKGGKPNLNVVPSNPALDAYMKGALARRIEVSKAWKPSKDQPHNPDPIVSIITDGRFAAIDPRFFGAPLPEDSPSIITEMGAKVVDGYKAHRGNVYLDKNGTPEPIKGGTQIVFYNLGFGEGAQKSRGFNARAAFTKILTDGGIPRAEIAWFDDANTDAKKEAVFKDMRSGKLKVLIGSAKKMGTGVNVQKRLAVLHYQDPPWFPADVEQPHGRIIRQGNQNGEVAIEWYTTKGTYQSTMWQMVGRKQRFIDQAFTGDKTLRSMDDLGEASLFEQAAAVASGDPRAIQLAGLKQDVERFERLQAAHASEQVSVSTALRYAGYAIESAQGRIKKYSAAFKAIGESYFSFTTGKVGTTEFNKQGEFGQAIKTAFNKAALAAAANPAEVMPEQVLATLGNGITVTMEGGEEKTGKPTGWFDLSVHFGGESLGIYHAESLGADVDAVGLARRIINQINSVEVDLRQARTDLLTNETDTARLRKKLGAPFEYQQEMAEKYGDLKRLEAELRAEGEAKPAPSPQGITADGEIGSSSLNLQSPPPLDFKRQPPVMFSRQAATTRGTPVPQVQAMVDAITAHWANAPEVVVVSDMQDAKVPQRVREADQLAKSQGAEGEPDGFIYKGTVYLVASELPTINDAVRVLMHESLGHSGLRGIFGDTLKPILNQVAAMRRADIVTKAREYGLLNLDTPRGATVNEQWQAMTEKNRQVAAEEVLAVMAQTKPELGFVKRAVAAIRNWLRTNVPGFKSLSMTDADIIQAFIFPARRQIEGRQSSSPVKNTSLEAIAQRELNLLDLIACLG